MYQAAAGVSYTCMCHKLAGKRRQMQTHSPVVYHNITYQGHMRERGRGGPAESQFCSKSWQSKPTKADQNFTISTKSHNVDQILITRQSRQYRQSDSTDYTDDDDNMMTVQTIQDNANNADNEHKTENRDNANNVDNAENLYNTDNLNKYFVMRTFFYNKAFFIKALLCKQGSFTILAMFIIFFIF